MKKIIDIKDLVKIYKMGEIDVKAIDSISFCIEEGEFVAIMGASGSGKSTLLHIIGCLDKSTSGSYNLDGEDVNSLNNDALAKLRNRKIGFVFQAFNLLPRLNAIENVEMPLLYSGNTEAKDRAAEALRAVGLLERMKHNPNQLSGGERQRVAIARAIVTNPAMILADEPTGNLDTKTSHEILNLFEQLYESGRTIILVTHEHDIAERCKRTIHIKDGKIVN